MNIRLNVVGGDFKTLNVEEDSTVGDVLASEGINAKSVRINMVTVKMDTVLKENDSIYVVPKIKGNN